MSVGTGEGEGESEGQEWAESKSEVWLAVRDGGWMKTAKFGVSLLSYIPCIAHHQGGVFYYYFFPLLSVAADCVHGMHHIEFQISHTWCHGRGVATRPVWVGQNLLVDVGLTPFLDTFHLFKGKEGVVDGSVQSAICRGRTADSAAG